MEGDGSWFVPLPGTRDNTPNGSRENRSHRIQVWYVAGIAAHLGLPGLRAQHGHGRAQPVPGYRAGRMRRTIWEGSFHK